MTFTTEIFSSNPSALTTGHVAALLSTCHTNRNPLFSVYSGSGRGEPRGFCSRSNVSLVPVFRFLDVQDTSAASFGTERVSLLHFPSGFPQSTSETRQTFFRVSFLFPGSLRRRDVAVLQRGGCGLSLPHRASFPPLGTIGPRSGLAAMMPRTAQRLFLFPGPLLAVPGCSRSLHAAAFSYPSVSHTEKTPAAGARTKQREGGDGGTRRSQV